MSEPTTYPHRYDRLPGSIRLVGRYCRCRDCGEMGTIVDEVTPGPCLARTVRVHEARLRAYREAIEEAGRALDSVCGLPACLLFADADAEAAAVLAAGEAP